MNIKREYQEKQGREYITTYTSTEPEQVYKALAEQLISRYIHKASYIKSVKRVNNFDGTQRITIQEDNGGRNVYTIED